MYILCSVRAHTNVFAPLFRGYALCRPFTESIQGPHEKRLLNNLLAAYNTLERPVANESEALQVKFGLTLQQIIDVVSVRLHAFLLPIWTEESNIQYIKTVHGPIR